MLWDAQNKTPALMEKIAFIKHHILTHQINKNDNNNIHNTDEYIKRYNILNNNNYNNNLINQEYVNRVCHECNNKIKILGFIISICLVRYGR